MASEYIVNNFLTFTLGIVVYFTGVNINKSVPFLRKYNIPEPVSGGLAAALISLLVFLYADIQISFELDLRNVLLIYFFTGIGLNARLSDLVSGGKPLLIMLALTLCYIVVQNIVGITGASLVGAPAPVGVLAGSASLIGGHGTTIAWAPEVVLLGVENAMKIGIASATIGLVLASLIGGPIAHLLIQRFGLKPVTDDDPVVGVTYEEEETGSINHKNLMAVFLTLHLTIIAGWLFNQSLSSLGMKLPLFVTCLLIGIVFSNIQPQVLPALRMPVRTKALAIVSDFSLGLFLSISLMSMQLWTISSVAGTLAVILLLQTVAAVAFILFVVFPLMGRNYQAAVLSAGFGGFALGATPTAIANMTAVTKSHGPAAMAFIILPLVAAFFVDIANSFVIKLALQIGA